ncbi:pimeloyl-ACP methyl ester carboxylesterase [Kribbella amoyensis]|uniref:Pimeloyl-ACP methyl ester carboxylesterase n=1 Tax=Kribbella amoyensis TaxID=996641 RepID=A0A561BVP7_9ACTN|nr:alpha/beta fold hydrolase [Kribbella amoyensis]TWD82822.1 pimeloyl-ACP methyl ester carboxylesterase [Kribbella amoyensis]
MPTFRSYDGTELAYHVRGEGAILVCLPGGPARASEYLGDLGGLSADRRLVLLDSRGSGESAVPDDPDTYRCERLVDDVEALRRHLGLDHLDLLAHSAAGNLLSLYAARYPDRVGSAVLVAPGFDAVGLDFTDEEWLEAVRRRSGEPWYEEAFAALMRLDDGSTELADRLQAAPLFYGPWTEEARAAEERWVEQIAPAARIGFRSPGSFGDPAITRAALAELAAPVLLIGGELDPAPTPRVLAEYAALFPDAQVVVQPNAGHTPWIDDPAAFRELVNSFLDSLLSAVESAASGQGPRRRCPECRGAARLPGLVKTTNMGSGMGSSFGPCPSCDGLGYLTDDESL